MWLDLTSIIVLFVVYKQIGLWMQLWCTASMFNTTNITTFWLEKKNNKRSESRWDKLQFSFLTCRAKTQNPPLVFWKDLNQRWHQTMTTSPWTQRSEVKKKQNKKQSTLLSKKGLWICMWLKWSIIVIKCDWSTCTFLLGTLGNSCNFFISFLFFSFLKDCWCECVFCSLQVTVA